MIGKEKFTNFAGHIEFDKVGLRFLYEIAVIKKELDPHLCFTDLEQITKVKKYIIFHVY